MRSTYWMPWSLLQAGDHWSAGWVENLMEYVRNGLLGQEEYLEDDVECNVASISSGTQGKPG